MSSNKMQKKKTLTDLHPLEAWVISRWRTKYRFGEITLVIQDGLPQRIKKAEFYDDPRNDSTFQ